MKCSYHPEAEALDLCPVCGCPVCDQCTVSLSGKNYCRACLEKMTTGLPGRPQVKSRFWAFVLSLAPGCGYFYLGLMKRGLQTMVLFFGTIFVSAFADIGALSAFVLPVIMFYSIFDTQQLVSRINLGLPLEDRELFDWGSWEKRRGFIGGGLIVLGLLALLDNLIPYLFDYRIIRNTVPPLAIISIGIYILYRNMGKGGTGSGNSGQDNSN